MKTTIVTIALLTAFATHAYAEVSADQVKACETEYRAKNKADKAAAPEGFKPDRPKGYKADFIATCLSKNDKQAAK